MRIRTFQLEVARRHAAGQKAVAVCAQTSTAPPPGSAAKQHRRQTPQKRHGARYGGMDVSEYVSHLALGCHTTLKCIKSGLLGSLFLAQNAFIALNDPYLYRLIAIPPLRGNL